MFKFLGRFTAAYPWHICAAWLGAAVLLTLAAPAWDSRAQDDDVRFLPARCDSVRGYELLKQAFPQDVFASRAVFAVERADGPLSEADFGLVDRMVDDLNALRAEEPDLQLGRVYSHRDPFLGKRLVSADGQCTLIQAALPTPYLALQTQKTVDRAEARLRRRLAEAGTGAPSLVVTGSAGVGRDLVKAGDSSIQGTTLATIALVVIVLLLVYRAPLLALVPLATIAVSVWVALKVLALLTLVPGFYLVNVSKVFAIVLLYGAGTDYCLFLISRYREGLARGEGLSRAVSRSVALVGGALAASAATVICGLGLMGVAEFAKVRCAGPAIALSLAVVLLASLTLAPALLHLLGSAVFWPGRQTGPAEGRWRVGLWDWISQRVVERPGLTWAVAVLVLLPLVVVGLRVEPNYRPTGELGQAAQSLQGVEVIRRHFTAGETGPVTVLLASSADWTGPEGQRLVGHLSRAIARLDNVAEVRSLTQPLGSPLSETLARPAPAKGALAGLLASVRQQAQQSMREFYVAPLPAGAGGPARSATRLDVILHSDPFDAQSTATLETIQTLLRDELARWPGAAGNVQAESYGVTANARDLARVTEGDRGRINTLAVGAIFLVLLVLVRRPWLAAYLLVTVLFSYFATLGATAIAGKVFGGHALTEVDWRVPFFLFTILVAVGEDYNILLVDRMLKERKRHGSEEGTRRALAGTGGTITSCGLIMAGTFGTLMLARLGTLVQIGFALAFGVLLDTFVVRPFLVPAFALLVWRWKEGREPRPVVVKAVLPAARRRAG